MSILRTLLYPASLLYRGITGARNLLYDKQVLHSERFEVPVLVVGNLTVGGTGKTPHVEYLLRLLKDRVRVAVLSRGYKRKTKGFRLAGAADTATTLGDEPMLYHKQFPEVQVAVGENRPAAIQQLLEQVSPPEVLVLDDAFQHRPLQASFYLLLTDYGRLFYNDEVLPAGLLRESRHGAERAQAVVVTKCPPMLQREEQVAISRSISRYTRNETPVFFTTYAYGSPVAMGHQQPFSNKVLLLTGIANPAPLRQHLQQLGHQVVAEATYPDHFAYRVQEVAALRRQLQQFGAEEVAVVTTSKDAIKLQQPELKEALEGLPMFYVPVQVAFADGRQQQFDQMILAAAGVAAAKA